MRAVAAQNARVNDPVYHVVLSWPKGETPTDDQAFACARHAVKSVGMEGHQYVFAIHMDTAHAHVHIAVNRVSPETFRAVYPDRDFYKLDRAMRELELQFGWQHDRGPYSVFERDGKRVIDWASSAPESKGHTPTVVGDMERHSDRESFFSYVRGEPRKAVIEALKDGQLTWTELHAVLARFGIGLREKGQGFAIVDQLVGGIEATGIMVKASDMHEELSKARLVKRLGPYEPMLAAVAAEQNYDKFIPPVRPGAERDQRRQQRADARRQLQISYAEYLAEFGSPIIAPTNWRARFAELRDLARRRRATVRATIQDRNERRAQLSIIAFETARERQRLRERAMHERETIKIQHVSARQSYREWVEHMAAAGDAGAISQLRGWAYAKTRRSSLAEIELGTGASLLRPRVPPGPHAPATLDGVNFRVLRDGAVRYSVGNAAVAFVDHGGYVEVPASVERHRALAALLFATSRFGMAFDIDGDGTHAEMLRKMLEQFPGTQPLQEELRRASYDLAQRMAVLRASGISASRPRVER